MTQTIEGNSKQLFQNESAEKISSALSVQGQYCHPDFFSFYELDDEELSADVWKERLNKWADDNHLEVSCGLIESFVDDEHLELIQEDPRQTAQIDFSEITGNWCLAAVYQTEDGPYVALVRQQLAA